MTERLWSKGSQGNGEGGPDDSVQDFLAGEDIAWDRHLFAFDIRATRAHVRGLQRIGLLPEDEAKELVAGLDALAEAFEAGEYVLGPPHEDGHSAIEAWLTERLGDVGRKVHAGRSRNDQVQVALRLYMRDRLDRLVEVCRAIAAALLDCADADRDTVTEAALADENVQRFVADKAIRKTIVVPGRLVNVVV